MSRITILVVYPELYMKWHGDCVWFSCVIVELLSLLLVSVLWGCTNPLLKRGAEGIENVTKTNRVSQLLAEVKFLFLNLKVNLKIKFASVYFVQTFTFHDKWFWLHLLPYVAAQYLVPFLLNQSGSLVYYYTLSTTGEAHTSQSIALSDGKGRMGLVVT